MIRKHLLHEQKFHQKYIFLIKIALNIQNAMVQNLHKNASITPRQIFEQLQNYSNDLYQLVTGLGDKDLEQQLKKSHIEIIINYFEDKQIKFIQTMTNDNINNLISKVSSQIPYGKPESIAIPSLLNEMEKEC